MSSRIAQVVIGAVDPQVVAAFWCDVLEWTVLEIEEDIVCIGPEGGVGMGIDVMPVQEPKAGVNRLHLDLRANGVTRDVELARLEALGARRVDVGQGPDASWTVLADPEGNEFCLLSRTVHEAATPP